MAGFCGLWQGVRGKRKTVGNELISNGLAWCEMVGVVELESTTSTVSTWRSNQLSYTPSSQNENSIYYTIDLRKVKHVFRKMPKKGTIAAGTCASGPASGPPRPPPRESTPPAPGMTALSPPRNRPHEKGRSGRTIRGKNGTSSLIFPCRYDILSRWSYHARLVKLADTKDLGSFAVRHAGSSPAPRTTFSRPNTASFPLHRRAKRVPPRFRLAVRLTKPELPPRSPPATGGIAKKREKKCFRV